MGFEYVGNDDEIFRFRDTMNDPIKVRVCIDGDIGILLPPRENVICLNREIARTLGSILIRYARDGNLEGAREIIEDADDEAEAPSGDRIAPLQDRLDAVEESVAAMGVRLDGIVGRIGELERDLTTVRECDIARLDELAKEFHKAKDRAAAEFAAIDRRLVDYEKASSRHFDAINGLAKRLDAIEGLARTISSDEESQNERLHRLGGFSAEHTSRIAELEARLATLATQFDVMDQHFDDHVRDMDRRVTEIGNRIQCVEGWQRNRDRERAELAIKPVDPPAPKTPQQIADDLTAKFPIGTKVRYRRTGQEAIWDDGVIISGFLAIHAGSYAVAVADCDGYKVFAEYVEARD